MTIAKSQDARLEALDQTTKIFEQSFRTQFKGIRAHLEDLESWKKRVDSQMANLAESVPRQPGRLPGRPEVNPRSHTVAAMTLGSGKELEVVGEQEKEEDVAQQENAGRPANNTGRPSTSPGLQDPSPV